MGHFFKALLLILALILQGTLCNLIEIMGVVPSVVIAVVVAVAFFSRNVMEAGAYGLFTGIMWDLSWGRIFGVHALFLMYTAIFIYFASEFLYKKNLFLCVAFTFCASALYETFFYLAGFFIFGETNFLYVFFRVIIPAAAYTGIAQIFLYSPVVSLCAGRRKRGIGL